MTTLIKTRHIIMNIATALTFAYLGPEDEQKPHLWQQLWAFWPTLAEGVFFWRGFYAVSQYLLCHVLFFPVACGKIDLRITYVNKKKKISENITYLNFMQRKLVNKPTYSIL